MFSSRSQPIVAIATAPGRGAVGIVRISGQGLEPLVQALLGRQLVPREASYLPFPDAKGQPIDQGLALWFPAPHSYTGEDVLELQAHGGNVVLQLLLARCLELGADKGVRLAEPGEFTQRAFLNDKLDLAQALAIALTRARRDDVMKQTAQDDFAYRIHGQWADGTALHADTIVKGSEAVRDFLAQKFRERLAKKPAGK